MVSQSLCGEGGSLVARLVSVYIEVSCIFLTSVSGWNYAWRRDLFEWERELVSNLTETLAGVVVGVGQDRWVVEAGGGWGFFG